MTSSALTSGGSETDVKSAMTDPAACSDEELLKTLLKNAASQNSLMDVALAVAYSTEILRRMRSEGHCASCNEEFAHSVRFCPNCRTNSP